MRAADARKGPPAADARLPASRRRRALLTRIPTCSHAGREADAFERLQASARMTRYGGDCYAYCLLAAASSTSSSRPA